jgi:hypothetical protein
VQAARWGGLGRAANYRTSMKFLQLRLLRAILILKECPITPEHMLARIGKGYWSGPEYLPVWEVAQTRARRLHNLDFVHHKV